MTSPTKDNFTSPLEPIELSVETLPIGVVVGVGVAIAALEALGLSFTIDVKVGVGVCETTALGDEAVPSSSPLL